MVKVRKRFVKVRWSFVKVSLKFVGVHWSLLSSWAFVKVCWRSSKLLWGSHNGRSGQGAGVGLGMLRGAGDSLTRKRLLVWWLLGCWFLGFWTLGFLVSWIQRFLVSSFQSFKDLQTNHVVDRYWSHIQDSQELIRRIRGISAPICSKHVNNWGFLKLWDLYKDYLLTCSRVYSWFVSVSWCLQRWNNCCWVLGARPEIRKS